MAQLHYISKALGQLQKDGWLFPYSVEKGFLSWDPDYLESVLTHYYHELSVMEWWEWERFQGESPAVFLTEEENTKMRKNSMDFTHRWAERMNRGS